MRQLHDNVAGHWFWTQQPPCLLNLLVTRRFSIGGSTSARTPKSRSPRKQPQCGWKCHGEEHCRFTHAWSLPNSSIAGFPLITTFTNKTPLSCSAAAYARLQTRLMTTSACAHTPGAPTSSVRSHSLMTLLPPCPRAPHTQQFPPSFLQAAVPG
jgi:hypothetical protein